jgi:hypothetical protein
MFLNSGANSFKVEIPRPFIPKHIKQKYQSYLKRLPTPIADISDLINHTIQSVTVPSVSYDPIVQQQTKENPRDPKARGFSRSFRSTVSDKELVDKTFSITFKMVDGYLNYWIMQEVFWHYYDFRNDNTYTYNIPIRILDADGIVMFSSQYSGVLFTGLGELELSYANNIREFKSFDCNFTYQTFDTSLDIQ